MTTLTFTDTRSRTTDCDTSHAAAKAAVSRKADAERQAIIAVVKAACTGLTAREVAERTGIEWHETSRRISECGLIKTALRRGGCAVWAAA